MKINKPMTIKEINKLMQDMNQPYCIKKINDEIIMEVVKDKK